MRERGRAGPGKQFIKKEISCRTTAVLLAYVKKYLPEHRESFRARIAELGLTESYLTREVNWVSFEYVNFLYDLLYEITRDPFILYRVGNKTDELAPRIIPVIMFRIIRSPRFAFRQCARFSHLYERISRVNILDMGGNYAVVEEEFEHFQQTWHSYQYGRGIYARIPEGLGRELVSAEMLECSVPIHRTALHAPSFRLEGDQVIDLEGNRVAHRDAPFKYRGTLYNSKNDVHKIVWKNQRPLFQLGYPGSARRITEIIDRLEENNRELEDKARLEMELELARKVQEHALPAEAPPSPDWDIAFITRPMSVVSGDFYDFYEHGDSLTGVGIFDVAGHGIAAGLITLLARSVIAGNFDRGAGGGLADVMRNINRELHREIGGLYNYLTGILLRFSGDGIEYANAGHPHMIIKPAGGGARPISGQSGKGTLLGILTTQEDFTSLSITPAQGSTFFLFTDCLSEEENEHGVPYGDRLTLAIDTLPSGDAAMMLAALMEDFYVFTGRREGFFDDLTVIVIKKK